MVVTVNPATMTVQLPPPPSCFGRLPTMMCMATVIDLTAVTDLAVMGEFFSGSNNGRAFGSGDSSSAMAPSHASSLYSQTFIDDDDEDLDNDGLPLTQDTTALSLSFDA
ncbi:uncharacterized protein DS421_17g583530 [Arachis hypogaea]|nr:uncharacterized protein DS421_17g583530 [Arachis hypogaea]